MRINRLEIRNVRGIRDINLEPNGKNVVIWGPNGSGKSAVVDAIDFLLSGRITRLEGEGTTGITLRRHGPHIDSNPAAAEVRAVVIVPGYAESVTISRRMSEPDSIRIEPEEAREALAPVLAVANSGQYVLARREILRFITAKGGDRAKWIQDLLHLEALETTRKTLGTAATAAKSEAAQAKVQLETARAAFAASAGLQKWDPDESLGAVNEARGTLNADPLAELQVEALQEGVTAHAVVQADANAVRLAAAAEQLIESWSECIETLRAGIKDVAAEAKTLCEDNESLALLTRRDLIERGLPLIESDGSCPLCGYAWPPGELRVRLAKDLSLSEAAEARRQSLVERASEIRTQAVGLHARVVELRETASKLGFIDDDSSIHAAASELDDYKKALAVSPESLGLNGVKTWEMPSVLSTDDFPDVVGALGKRAAELNPQMSPEQQAWDRLTRLTENLRRIRETEKALDEAQTLQSKAEALSRSFVEARDAVLNELYETIRDRFVELYKELHAEDGEDAFRAVLEHEGAAVKFEVDFFDRGLHPPQALHSEGHQDSMGVCLYLALSEYVNKGVVGLIVLDDVVMSVDSGHRKRLCGLLRDKFAQNQFIITTHDRNWAHQLRKSGVVSASGMVQFCGWTVAGGPRLVESDIWARVDRCLEDGDVRGAASHLRGSMEEFFAGVCEDLRAPVVYKSTGQYTLGDFLPSAWKRYSNLLALAKDAENSWGHDDAVDRLVDAHSVAKQCYSRTTAEQWAANKGVHYDQWFSLEAPDLRDIVDAFKDLCEVFRCTECGSPLTLSVNDFEEDAVRCACQKVNWNLRKKTG